MCLAADSQQHHLSLTSSCVLSSFSSILGEGTNHAVPHGPSRLLPSSLCSHSMDLFSSRCQLNSKHLSTFNYHHLSEDKRNPEADRQNKITWWSFTPTPSKNSPLSFNDPLKLSGPHRHQLLSGRCVGKKCLELCNKRNTLERSRGFVSKSLIYSSLELGRKHYQKHKPNVE